MYLKEYTLFKSRFDFKQKEQALGILNSKKVWRKQKNQ